MKWSLSIIILCIQFYCACGQALTPETELSKLNWLLGTWSRTNVKPGQTASERWEKLSEMELQGYGVSLRGGDTTFVEKLKIIAKDDNIYYVADVAENKTPIYFKFSILNKNGFTCENPEHDFPKKIEYRLTSENQLQAIVSGNGKEINFLFKK